MIIFVPLKRESQRVPNKNFRYFGKVPLFKRTLSLYSNHKVFVDTDSDEVISLIQNDKELAHVSVYCRSERLRGHETSLNVLIDDFFRRFPKIEQELVAQIHVTSPFLKASTVEKAFKKLKESSYDSACSVDVIQARCWRTEGCRSIPVNHNPNVLEQTQDINPILVENSCFYIFNRTSFFDNGRNRVGKNPYFCEVGYPENLDIDTEDDWKRCSQLFSLQTEIL